MLEHLTKAALLVVAAIHLMPVVGFFGTSALAGILGALFAYAAFHPPTRPVASAVAGASIASFLYLAATVTDTTRAIRKIAIADLIAIAALALWGQATLPKPF
jgi:hypothetical protein